MLIAQGLRRELAGVSEVADAIRRVTRRFLVPAAWLKFRHGVSWVPAVFLLRHRTVASAYFRVFSEAGPASTTYDDRGIGTAAALRRGSRPRALGSGLARAGSVQQLVPVRDRTAKW